MVRSSRRRRNPVCPDFAGLDVVRDTLSRSPLTVLVAVLAFGIGVATGVAIRRVRARSRTGRIGPPDRRWTAPSLDQSGIERAALAHQLRNPLGSIRIAIEMLRNPEHDDREASAADASGWVHEVGWA